MRQIPDPILAQAIQRRDAARREAIAWEDWISRYESLRLGSQSVAKLATIRPTQTDPWIGRQKSSQTPVIEETFQPACESVVAMGRPVDVTEQFRER
jgi:hypothetical protein